MYMYMYMYMYNINMYTLKDVIVSNLYKNVKFVFDCNRYRSIRTWKIFASSVENSFLQSVKIVVKMSTMYRTVCPTALSLIPLLVWV